MSQLPERPFFIVGHPRSGTTLLRFLVSGHSRIYVPEETGFIPFLLPQKRVRQRLTPAEVRQLLSRMGDLNYLWHDLVDDVQAFYQSLPQPTLAHVLDALYGEKVQEHGAVRWGDKTPVYLQYVDVLDAIFPDAQFIHVIRDGRDAALSALQKWPERAWYMDLYYLLKHWDRNVRAGRAAGQHLGGDRYLEVHYEALVQHPHPVVRQIADFLGETYEPSMLDHTALAREVGPGPQGHTEVQHPITTSRVGRWKDEMSGFEQKLARRLAGSTLDKLGYGAGPEEPMHPSELLRFSWLAAKFRVFDTARSALYALGIFTLNRDLRRS